MLPPARTRTIPPGSGKRSGPSAVEIVLAVLVVLIVIGAGSTGPRGRTRSEYRKRAVLRITASCDTYFGIQDQLNNQWLPLSTGSKFITKKIPARKPGPTGYARSDPGEELHLADVYTIATDARDFTREELLQIGSQLHATRGAGMLGG